MTSQLRVMLCMLLTAQTLAAEDLPKDVSEFIERREVCEHFRQEPWPEGISPQETERRVFISEQITHFCTGSDNSLQELKQNYRDNRAIVERLEKYETKIER